MKQGMSGGFSHSLQRAHPADCFSPINRTLGGIICVLKALLVLYSANTKAASASAATSVLLEVLNLLKARLPDRHVAILLPISRPFSINTGLVTAVVRHTMPLLRLHIRLPAHPADIFLGMLLHAQWLAPFDLIAGKELAQKGEHTLCSVHSTLQNTHMPCYTVQHVLGSDVADMMHVWRPQADTDFWLETHKQC